MTISDNDEFYVGDVRVIPMKNAIQGSEGRVKVSSRSIQLLQYLVSRAGKIVTFQEVNDNIWAGRCSENSFYQQVAALRKALGDDSHNPTLIQTVAKQGYKFIGDISSVHGIESKEESAAQAQAVTGWLGSQWWLVAVPVVLTVVCAALWFLSSSTNYNRSSLFYPLVDQLRNPSTSIVIEQFPISYDEQLNSINNVLIQLTQHHLTTKREQHATTIPVFSRDTKFYSQIKDHFQSVGGVDYIFRPNISGDGKDYIFSLYMIDADTHSLDVIFSFREEKKNTTGGIKRFENELLAIFSELALTNSLTPVLNENADATQWFIETIKSSSTLARSRGDVELSIRNAQKTVELNPNNLIAYSVLWREILHLIGVYSDFNLDAVLDKISSTTKRALEISPNFHRAKFAQADKMCWLGEFKKCRNGMRKALKEYPYSPNLIDSLYWNITDSPERQLITAKKNYELNPFYDRSFATYRNALLSVGDFHSFSRLVSYHAKWSDPKDWFVQAQSPTDIDMLQQQAEYYRNTYLNITPHSMDGSELLPSKYIGYSLLNGNQPDLARFWAANGMERDLPYFDLQVLPLWVDMWEGDWKPLEWQVVRSYAMDRAKYQNALDQLTIAYFDFYTGWIVKSADMFLNLRPDLESKSPVISDGNVRVFIYYSEIQKRLENFRYVNKINPLIEEYLKTKQNAARGIEFGIADVEFYALNDEKEKALELLDQAVTKQGWLPNSLWMWPPLERNVFLNSIKNTKEFYELNNLVNSKLSKVCFTSECT